MVSTSDEIADDKEVHGGDNGEGNDVGKRKERDEQRRTVATVIAEAAEVVRHGVGRQRERLNAVDGEQRRVNGQHRDPDADHNQCYLPGRRHWARRRPDDGDEANYGDCDESVNGDVDCSVEYEVRQLTGDVTDEPVVGGVVVCNEWDRDDEEEDVTECEIQQQQIDGRLHGVARQRDVDDQRVADDANTDDESEHHWDDDLVQDVVKQ